MCEGAQSFATVSTICFLCVLSGRQVKSSQVKSRACQLDGTGKPRRNVPQSSQRSGLRKRKERLAGKEACKEKANKSTLSSGTRICANL